MVLKSLNDSQATVANYFDKTLPLYAKWWSSRHLHYGFWEKDTKDITEALENTIKFVINCLEVKNGDFILDMGCGTGGTCLYLASKFSVNVFGVNISVKQLKLAKKLVHSSMAASKIRFLHQDFINTQFPDNYFKNIVAIESVCHSLFKKKFLQESYRLLKKGGKIVISDGFINNMVLEEKRQQNLLDDIKTWAITSLDTIQDFTNKMRDSGFRNIQYFDKKSAISKTIWLIHRKGKKAYPVSYLLSKLKIIPKTWHDHTIGAYRQKKWFDNNILTYGVFVAQK